MTIPGFGRVTPIQGAMLQLAGYNLDPLKYGFDPARPGSEPIPDDDRKAIMEAGLLTLRATTGQDFGYDLTVWHSYLKSHPEFGYTHPYAYRNTRELIQTALADPERRRLVTELGG